jgi:hypothetical protein
MTNEVRVTDPVTGGQKGMKDERMDLVPWEPIRQISRVYAYGAGKYSDHNWRKGYKWSLSYAALMRHLTAFWEGEDFDKESGLSHLAHAGFHILALLWFSVYRKSHDDRPVRGSSEVEQEAHNLKVGGSIPPPATNYYRWEPGVGAIPIAPPGSGAVTVTCAHEELTRTEQVNKIVEDMSPIWGPVHGV